jgi:hypothetical protein
MMVENTGYRLRNDIEPQAIKQQAFDKQVAISTIVPRFRSQERNAMSTTAKPAPPTEKEPTKVYTFTLPPSLIAQIDAIAAEEGRSRARQVAVFLRDCVRNYRRGRAA